jgi:hypothetical protein
VNDHYVSLQPFTIDTPELLHVNTDLAEGMTSLQDDVKVSAYSSTSSDIQINADYVAVVQKCNDPMPILTSGEGDAVSECCYDNDIGGFISKAIDDYTKFKILEPPKDYKLPFSIHNKKGKVEKRYLSQSHLQQYPWLVYSHFRKGLFCKYCPFFVTSHSGGFQRNVPLKQLVTEPLQKFAKLLGKDGDLETHSRNKYHVAAVEAGNNFVSTFHNPALEVINQVSTQ